MMRRIILAAALLAAAGRWAQAATCGPPYGAGPVLNGFEGTPDGDPSCTGEIGDVGDWTVTSNPAWTPAVIASTGSLPVVEGDYYGYVSWTPTTNSVTLTLPSADFSADAAWNSYNYVFVAYASESTSAAPSYSFEYKFTNGLGVSATFVQPGGLISNADYTEATQYTYAITSLNYVRNLGYSTTAISQLALENFYDSPSGGAPVGVAYDDLQLDPASGTLDSPNSPVPEGQVGGTAGCGGFDLSWTAQAQTGGSPDAIAGYHIYRATEAGGPWTSVYYLSSSAVPPTTLYYDDTTDLSSTYYYIVLPYSTTTNAFGNGATGYFTRCNSGLDPATQDLIGVNEAALGSATEAGPFNPQAGCSPTPTPTLTPTATDSPTLTSTYTLTQTYTVTPTYTASPSVTVTLTPSPTSADTDTPGTTPGATDTPGGGGGGPTNTPGFTDTPTLFVTPTPVETLTSVEIYPNPFYPDRGETFHLGNVPPGVAWTMFDLIGKFVYQSGAGQESWNGYNANGIEVTTGIYFIVLQGKVYRLAVVRN